MAYVALPLVTTGTPIVVSWGNQIRDNFAACAAAIVTTAGDLVYATGPNALARLPRQPNKILHSGATTPGWISLATASVSIPGETERNSAPASWGDVPGYTVNITTSCKCDILAICSYGYKSNGGGSTYRERLVIDGTAVHTSPASKFNTLSGSLIGRKAGLNAGTYTVKMQDYAASANDGHSYWDGAILVWALPVA